MRFGLMGETYRRPLLTLLLMCVMGTAASGQDQRDWQSLTQLRPGESILLSLKASSVKGAFRSWTPQQVIAGATTARREDVLKVERYRQSGWGRGEKALVGALIGFGAGFTIGAAAAGCHTGQFGPCVTRFGGGMIVGGVGAVGGVAIGALLPRRHTKELIYSAN